jgi:hypothetical protein
VAAALPVVRQLVRLGVGFAAGRKVGRGRHSEVIRKRSELQHKGVELNPVDELKAWAVQCAETAPSLALVAVAAVPIILALLGQRFMSPKSSVVVVGSAVSPVAAS